MKRAGVGETATDIYESPIGWLCVEANDIGVIRVVFKPQGFEPEKRGRNEITEECVSQLGEYFDSKRSAFDIPLDLRGTPFQLLVWRTLLLIPCGEIWNYGKVAKHIGRENAARAVGGANHSNPVSIIVPCHRVTGSTGKLVGYGGGLWRKEWLLEHEKKIVKRPTP